MPLYTCAATSAGVVAHAWEDAAVVYMMICLHGYILKVLLSIVEWGCTRIVHVVRCRISQQEYRQDHRNFSHTHTSFMCIGVMSHW